MLYDVLLLQNSAVRVEPKQPYLIFLMTAFLLLLMFFAYLFSPDLFFPVTQCYASRQIKGMYPWLPWASMRKAGSKTHETESASLPAHTMDLHAPSII